MCEGSKPQLQKQHIETCIHGRDVQASCRNWGEWAIAVTTKSEKHHFTFWSLEQRVAHLIALHLVLLGSRSARSETPFSSFPPWPSNYPNLPSSCTPAPATLAQTTSVASLSVLELPNNSMASLCRLLAETTNRGGGVGGGAG